MCPTFGYYFNFSLFVLFIFIKLVRESVKTGSCFSPLIWLAVVSLDETGVSHILHTRFLWQLDEIATQESSKWKYHSEYHLFDLSLFRSSFRFITRIMLLCFSLQKLCIVTHFVKCKWKWCDICMILVNFFLIQKNNLLAMLSFTGETIGYLIKLRYIKCL